MKIALTADVHLTTRAKHPEREIEKAPPQLLQQDGYFDRSCASTPILFGSVDAEPPLLAELGIEINRRLMIAVARTHVN